MKQELARTPSLSHSSNRLVKLLYLFSEKTIQQNVKEQDFNNLWTLMTNIFQGMAYNANDLAELKQGIIVKHVFGCSCPIAKIV